MSETTHKYSSDKEYCQEMFKAVRMYVHHHYPFWGHLLGKLRPTFYEGDDAPIPTLATDGKKLMVNMDYFMDLHEQNKMLAVSSVIHEIFHCLMDFEIGRMENVPKHEHTYYNHSEDYLINGWLDQNGLPVHDEWLFDQRFMNNDLTVESIVEILKEEQPNLNNKPDCSCGRPHPEADGAQGDADNPTFTDVDILEADQEAEENGRNAGNMPGNLSRFIDELKNPPMDWDKVLFQYMTKADTPDWKDYSRMNRRSMSGTFDKDFIMPVDNGEKVEMRVYIDTSGSIQSGELAQSIGLINQLCRQKNVELNLIWWDTKLHPEEKTFRNIDWNAVEPKGGGGTHIQPVVDDHEEKSPLVSVCFTDGFFSSPDHCPKNMIYILYEGGTERNLEDLTDQIYKIENRSNN